jgi:hypothetical protein
MPNRPAIPAAITRAILLEAGHRCAVCGTPSPLERAHIIPWHASHEHRAEDLICLCANCHERADKENWGEIILREYKKKPWVSRYQNTPPRPEPTARVEITVGVELRDFGEEKRRLLQHILAAFLDISPYDSEIVETRPGSVKVIIELPARHASKLLSAFERRDPVLFQYLEPLNLLAIAESLDVAPRPVLQIPFQNREDEIKMISSSFAPAYFLLDAPAGYGKSELLRRLAQRFKEEEWMVAHVRLEEHGDARQLVTALAEQLGVDYTPANANMAQCGRELAATLRLKRLDDIVRAGLVLLIDFDKRPSLAVPNELVNQFIPAIQTNLRMLEFFSSQHNRFRVILAGRYLAKQTIADAIRLKSLYLTPFNYDVVLETIRSILPDSRAVVTQLAAHLMHLTGGHPGCIARCIQRYVVCGETPDEFLTSNAQEVWAHIVRPTVWDVQNNVPQDLWPALDRLSIFRCLNYTALDTLTQEKRLIQGFDNGSDLADRLTTTYLLSWQGRFLKDDITRRLLTIRLRHEEKEYAEWCRQAQLLCAGHIQNRETQLPELWTIEYLYQALQEYASAVQDAGQRAALRDRFFDDYMPQALRWLFDGRQKLTERHALVEALENDWEFRFTLNYFLREDRHSDRPYQRLCQEIDAVP